MLTEMPGGAVDGQGADAAVAAVAEAVTFKFRNRNRYDVRIPASAIRVNPRNWRTHPDYQSGSLRKLLERIGFVGKLLAWEPEPGVYELIDGHLRKGLLGTDLVDVTVTDLNEQEVDELLAVYDQITGLAVPDTGKLQELLKNLQASAVPLTEIGWPQYKLDEILNTSWIPPAAGASVPGAVDPAAPGSAAGNGTPGPAPAGSVTPAPNLADRFLLPPFSVLNAREGWWQDRKRQWLSLGIKSELGRGEQLIPNGGGMGSKERYDGVSPVPEGATVVQDGLTWGNSEPMRHPTLNHYREQNAAARKVTPGGMPRPACDYSNGERGDGRGRPLQNDNAD